jgi:hypothetical protein
MTDYVLDRLVEAGNTVVVIEHNLDVIKNADWIIDLGSKGGDQGREIVEEGPPKEIAKSKRSYAGQVLKEAGGLGRADIPGVAIMRWIETASGSVLLAACSSKTRPRVACRRKAALSWLLSSHSRYGDSLHIHPFHPHAERKGEERLMALMAISRI